MHKQALLVTTSTPHPNKALGSWFIFQFVTLYQRHETEIDRQPQAQTLTHFGHRSCYCYTAQFVTTETARSETCVFCFQWAIIESHILMLTLLHLLSFLQIVGHSQLFFFFLNLVTGEINAIMCPVIILRKYNYFRAFEGS